MSVFSLKCLGVEGVCCVSACCTRELTGVSGMTTGVSVVPLSSFDPTLPPDADRGTGAGSRQTTGASAVEAPLALPLPGVRTGPEGTVMMSTTFTRSTSSEEDDLFLPKFFFFAAAAARARLAFLASDLSSSGVDATTLGSKASV